MWMTVKGKLLTTDSLKKQSIVIPDYCSMCMSDRNDQSLILHCWVGRDYAASYGVCWGVLGDF